MKFNKKVVFNLLILASFLILPNIVHVNSNEDTWTRTWTRGSDSGWDIVIDSQDNIYVVGTTFRSSEDNDICLLKYNKTGVFIWGAVWNRAGNELSMTMDTSENIYIAGTKNEDTILIKCNTQGEEIWNCTWGGSGYDRCTAIVTDSLNDIYVVGHTTSFGSGDWDGFILKFNSSGSQLWDIIWGTVEPDSFNDISIDDLNNIYLAGVSDSNAVLVKFNSSGQELWNATVDYYSYFPKLKVDSENNIIYASESLLQKFNSIGSLIWIRPLTEVDFLGDLTLDNNDNIYILDQREISCPPDNLYFGGISQCICVGIYLEKYNSSGAFIWEKRCNGCSSASGEGIFLDSSNNICICGTLHSTISCGDIQDILLIKNPISYSGICNEIYYDLIALGIVIPGIIILAIIIVIIKKRKS